MQVLFDAFRTFPHEINMLACALRTYARNRTRMTTIVAEKLCRPLVMCQRNAAIVTLDGLATASAEHKGRISAAIQQNQILLALLQAFSDFFFESPREISLC